MTHRPQARPNWMGGLANQLTMVVLSLVLRLDGLCFFPKFDAQIAPSMHENFHAQDLPNWMGGLAEFDHPDGLLMDQPCRSFEGFPAK